MRHTCHAPQCSAETAPRHLMCPACWSLVSEPAKAEVWKYYRPGQERDKKPSRLWLAAAMEAKADVMDARGFDGSGYRSMAARVRTLARSWTPQRIVPRVGA